MKIEVTSEQAVYVTIGDWVVYIDNSTGERIVTQWNEEK